MSDACFRRTCLALAICTVASAVTAEPVPDSPVADAAPSDPPRPAQEASQPAADAGSVEPEASEGQPPGTVAPAAAATQPIEVVVTARRRPRSDDASSVTEVGGDRLRASPRASTFEALSQQVPGLYVTSRGAGVHGIASGASGALHMRGLGGSPNTQVLVVEDGVPDYQGLFGHPIPDAYSSFLVDKVRVIRGGDSVLYGTNALGGVIVIESRRPGREGLELNNDVAWGSYGTLRERVALLTRLEDWDISGAFSALRTDGHRVGAGGSNQVAHLKLRWRPRDATRLAINSRLFHGTGADPGPITHPHPDHWYDARRATLSLQLRTVYRGLLLRMVPYLNTGIHRLYDGFYSRDHAAGAYADAQLPLAPGWHLLFGLAADDVGGWVENRAAAEVENVEGLTNLAAYGQLVWQPWQPLELVAGARGVQNTQYGFVPLYKLGVQVEVTDGIALRSRLVRNFRQPTVRERYLPYPTANPSLQPEYATNLDSGHSAAWGKFLLDAAVFRTHSQNLIRYFGAWPTAEVVNIDESTVYGAEGQAGIRDVGPLSLLATVMWQDVGRYTRQNPSHKANLTVQSRHPLGRGTLLGEVSGEWVGGLYENNYRRDPLDDVFFVDAALRYAFRLPAREITLEPYLLARNLLDLEYEYIRGYRMPGLNLLGGLRVTL